MTENESQRRMNQAREVVARWDHAESGSIDQQIAGNEMAGLLAEWLADAESRTQ